MRKVKTLAETIRELAARCGASEDYVARVRALFLRRGISLDDDSAPYEMALVEAFETQQTVRRSLREANDVLARLRDDLSDLGRACQEQLANLMELRNSMNERHRGLLEARRSAGTRQENNAHRVRGLVPGDRDMAVVPGPDDLQ